MSSFVSHCEAGTVTLKTAPNDPRFPLTNQTRACYVYYNELHKCVADNGADNAQCSALKTNVRTFCPDEWIARWDEMRETGTWYGKY